MKEAEVQTTKTQMIAIENSIQQFKLAKRRLPDSLDELVPDYLLSDEVPTDAWGNDFEYMVEGRNNFTLVSYGADGMEGGEDDEEDIDRTMLRKKRGGED